jgi:hypothetical protein
MYLRVGEEGTEESWRWGGGKKARERIECILYGTVSMLTVLPGSGFEGGRLFWAQMAQIHSCHLRAQKSLDFRVPSFS